MPRTIAGGDARGTAGTKMDRGWVGQGLTMGSAAPAIALAPRRRGPCATRQNGNESRRQKNVCQERTRSRGYGHANSPLRRRHQHLVSYEDI